jgi:hypothetical protein
VTLSTWFWIGGDDVEGFVAECRREWKRLGVSSSAADEMAAELEADLPEGTLEEVLGRDAADAAGFARSWAVERGVVRRRKTPRVFAAVAALAIVPAVVGVVLVIHDPKPGATSPTSRFAPLPDTPPARRLVVPRGAARAVWISGLDSREPKNGGSDTLGLVLLIAGLAVLVPATLFSSGRVALNG